MKIFFALILVAAALFAWMYPTPKPKRRLALRWMRESLIPIAIALVSVGTFTFLALNTSIKVV